MAARKKAETAIAVAAPHKQEVMSVEGLIQSAIDKGTPVETMERLLVMRNQIKAERAKEAFDAAMARFQADCPTITKTKGVSTRAGKEAYKYAPIESIVAQTKALIRANGFSYSFKQELKESGVRVGCIVKHEEGHSEESWMEVPLGNKTDIMSMSQVVAAASTFAKRYAFCNAFGILTGDDDNDGATETFDRSPVSSKTTPTITYDDHEDQTPETPQGLRNKLAAILNYHKIDFRDKKAAEQFVADRTQLSLVEENFAEIVRILETQDKKR